MSLTSFILLLILLWLLWKPLKIISNTLRNDQARQQTSTRSRQQTSQAQKQPEQKNDIISDGEGEYIDYEEVKDDSSSSG